MMAVRQGSWTSYPTDEQIRNQVRREYWNFPCPKCPNGGSCYGIGCPAHYIKCLDCGWEWYDTITKVIQTTLQEFIE